jgi:hypothetical protein
MRNHFARPLRISLTLLFALTVYSAVRAAPSPEDKLKAEDVVARHLASIGSAADLAAVKTLVAVGSSEMMSRSNTTRQLVGVSQIASEGDKVLLAMIFNSTAQPYEKAGYNGEKLSVAILPDGRRSSLGSFLLAHDAPFKQGLIGGVLSTAWPLLNTGAEMPKLSYAGTDKINDRKAHKLRYDPRKGGDLQITLFFDAETFRHVRTEYRYTIAARMGATAEQSIGQLESHYRVIEDFSDFKAEGKLTLPHTYKLSYTIEEQSNTRTLEWTMAFKQFAFNEQIDAKAFNIVAGS